MFQVASYETYEDGQVIFTEGTYGDWIYIIDEGAVEISKEIDGRKVVVGILKEGEILGELAYIAKIPRTASAVAVGRTVIGIIDRNFFDQEFNKLSGDFQKMIKMVAVRLKIATETICQAKLKGS
ncbi:MAG TPA: cyclic nucleotide-binding domain-containing protein [Syntrophales bacterium]|jgi:CRP-like cAMP-binding protein|nr:cyclic nucleotide-binding domain-containing protein [Syntrophales bacterium]HON24166.1 cyclic nucleotide-binding domain-containing protein [Syntrophales bacterium]HOU78832.1 cyclic nucleotide-binding domain-containing protein [Syntrophales bacterium]HPC32629.1 cyclic nucleotide-binding domain-containing protein [Syntrophales bacterium]HQG35496.1 cyclic nucleotide-binding domain-containing protein [Syntrophales bacterium]